MAYIPADLEGLRFGDAPQSFLLTGGTGFIGSALVRALLAQGHRVTLWVRDPVRASVQFQGRAACVDMLAQLGGSACFDVVINLAGAPILGPRWSAARKQVLLDSRVGVTRALVAWLATQARPPRLLVSGSAVGYYGSAPEEDRRPRTETDPPQGGFPSQLCRQWEEAARAAGALGISVAVVRLGVVLGREGGALPALLRPIRLGLSGRMGSGRQAQCWVHLDDVIAAMAWLCRRPGPAAWAVYNLAAPEWPTQRGLVRVAAALLHRPVWLPAPGWAIRLLLGEQATLLLDGVCVAPQRLQEEGFVFRHPTLDGALRDLLVPPLRPAPTGRDSG